MASPRTRKGEIQYQDSSKRPAIIVVAKHLCGDSSDTALLEIEKSSQEVQMVALAPCCHPQLSWDLYCNKKFLEENGFSASDFDVLKVLILMSKQKLTEQDFKDSPLRSLYPACQLQTFGRIARLLLEWGRKLFLEELGFKCCIVEYASILTTPDNLIILGTREPKGPIIDTSQHREAPPSQGILINPCIGGSTKFAERTLNQIHHYVLEMRGKDLLSGVVPSIEGAVRLEIELEQRIAIKPLAECEESSVLSTTTSFTVADPWKESLGECSHVHKRPRTSSSNAGAADGKKMHMPTLQAVILSGCPSKMLSVLTLDGVLRRTVGQLFPFTRRSESLQALVRDVMRSYRELVTSHSQSGASPTLRLLTYPRSLQTALCACLPFNILSPSTFSHTLTVTQLDTRLSTTAAQAASPCFLWSLLPRETWDLTNWGGGGSVRAKALLHREECLRRLPSSMASPTGRLVMVVSDVRKNITTMSSWCVSQGATGTSMVMPVKEGGAWRLHQIPPTHITTTETGETKESRAQGHPADVVFFSWSRDVLSALQVFCLLSQSNLVQRNAWYTGKMRISVARSFDVLLKDQSTPGPTDKQSNNVQIPRHSSRSVKVFKEVCYQEGFSVVRVRHFLTDHEQERTVCLRP